MTPELITKLEGAEGAPCPYPVIYDTGQCCGFDPCRVEWVRPCDADGGCWDCSTCAGCEEPVFPALAEREAGDA